MDPAESPVYHKTVIDNDWEISFVDTGEETLKGGRIKKLENYIQGDNFFLTYGDGVSNIDLKQLLDYHLSHKKIATVWLDSFKI